MTETTSTDEPRCESESEPTPPALRAADVRPPPGQVGDSAPATPGAVVVASAGTTQRRAQRRAAPRGARRARKADHRPAIQWTSIEHAAALLGVPTVTLRRRIERAAMRREDGSVITQVNGIVARKLGRVWRVWLDAKWRNPTAE